MKKAVGVIIRHRTARSQIVLVPILSNPCISKYGEAIGKCKRCNTVHLCETLHLYVNDTGSLMVSVGILETLKRIGMPDWTVVGDSKSPPTIAINGDPNKAVSRPGQDAEHRKIKPLTPAKSNKRILTGSTVKVEN